MRYPSQMPSLYADTLQSAERLHLIRLLLWGAASILAGSGLLTWMMIRAQKSDLLWHFAVQIAAWGAVDAIIGAIMLPQIVMRDIHSATRLDRFLWLNIGLDVGYVLVGITLLATGWRLGRRLGLVGAGMGVVVQGLALALLDMMFIARISL
ncbi:MAG: putative rane protein [Gemmatimonadetes bacterium]|nr:putative rane protein [Gemmatimonadota bacterium]